MWKPITVELLWQNLILLTVIYLSGDAVCHYYMGLKKGKQGPKMDEIVFFFLFSLFPLDFSPPANIADHKGK